MMNSVKAILVAASRNLEFIKDRETRLPKGHRIAHIRLDSAGYQANIFNYCEETSKTLPLVAGSMNRPSRPSRLSLNQIGSIMLIVP
ncbi:hypothetical protein [Nitrosomonas communis]|uniref:Uncharacterized protein n=1 Tax=Nitrosomonas communis TaxID=44574 RepID=A0A1I4V0L2_9PROT|nr:hypothetical protein [Nitrosomonas communis]SFM94732.1 hypothetical protein SAMN05421863_10743 [Nitrosomonas communis]